MAKKELKNEILKRCSRGVKEGFVESKVYRPAGIKIALLLSKTPMTGNQVTFLWFAIQTICSLLIFTGKYNLMVVGVLAWHFAMLLDYADGTLARIKKQGSPKGDYLAGLTHYFGAVFLFYAVTIAVYKNTQTLLYLVIGLTSVIALLLNKAIKLLFVYLKNQKSKGTETAIIYWIKLPFRLLLPTNIICVGIILGYAHFVLIVYLVLYTLQILYKLVAYTLKWDKN